MVIGIKDLSFLFSRTFDIASIYLMGCNALKNGREKVNCEDVVIGYLTCYKLILTDIRPTVHRLYNKEKWTDEKNYK